MAGECKGRTMRENAHFEEIDRIRRSRGEPSGNERALEIFGSSDIAMEIIRRKGYKPATTERKDSSADEKPDSKDVKYATS